MPLDVTRMIASVGCSMVGSGTSSTRTSWLPCQVRAFMTGGPTQLPAGQSERGVCAFAWDAGRARLAAVIGRRPLDPQALEQHLDRLLRAARALSGDADEA